MTILIAIPVYRLSCTVSIERGRLWSVVDEALLWAISRVPTSISELATMSSLPHQVVIASVARLMRFRLVEIETSGSGIAFRASQLGTQLLTNGEALPFFPKRYPKRTSFVVERATGDVFASATVQLMSRKKLDREKLSGRPILSVIVQDGEPPMTHEANLNRLSDIATRRWDERIATIDARTAAMHDHEFMIVRVIDGVAQDLPDSAGEDLRSLVAAVAAHPLAEEQIRVSYAGPRDTASLEPQEHACTFDPDDIIIGGSAQRTCLETLFGQAHSRIVLHSTFLDSQRFVTLAPMIQAACRRGVRLDLLWGAEKDERTEVKNALEASKIAAFARANRDLRGRVFLHMNSTGSHAKLILLDTVSGDWLASVGSCNWLFSPFRAVELSVVLRHQGAVADVALALQRLVGRRGLADDLANEMAIVGRDLRRRRSAGGSDRVSLLFGEAHDREIRLASHEARRRFVVGSNKLGSTARPGALMQGEAAAQRTGVQATVLFTDTTGPLKNRHARDMMEEARENGVLLARTKEIPLHGKFLAWDDDDVVVTSLNWASASADPDVPWNEIGVRVHAPGVASQVVGRLEAIFPMLAGALPQLQDGAKGIAPPGQDRLPA